MVRSAPVMRIQLAAALVASTLAFPGPTRAQEASAWWTQRLTYGAGPMLIENLWCKGPRMRAEFVFEGHPIVTLVDERRYVMLDEVTRTGVAIARSPASIALDAKRARPFGREADDLIAAGGEKVGSEMRAGEEVDHYRLTTPGGDQREVWVSANPFRLPAEWRAFDRGTGQESRVVYLRWVQKSFPDALFQPDAGVKLEQLTYEEYVARSQKAPVGPAPPLFSDLLHGPRLQQP
jgi:hypothetical protein